MNWAIFTALIVAGYVLGWAFAHYRTARHYTEDGCPLVCHECGGEHVVWVDMLNGGEYALECHRCDEELGYWSGAGFVPGYRGWLLKSTLAWAQWVGPLAGAALGVVAWLS